MKVDAPAGSFYLKESSSTESVEREAGLLRFLAGAGLSVPLHVPSTIGLLYAVDAGRVFSRKLPGRHFAQFEGLAALEAVGRLAVILGKLHRVLASAPTPELFPVFCDSAEELITKLLARAGPFDVRRLQRLRGEVASVQTLPHQLIHRDPHRFNMLFTGEELSGYLDFDLVHRCPRLFDLCYCASGVLSESFRAEGYLAYWLKVVESIFRGYGRVNRLSGEERSKAWNMLITIQLIFMSYCLDAENIAAGMRRREWMSLACSYEPLFARHQRRVYFSRCDNPLTGARTP